MTVTFRDIGAVWYLAVAAIHAVALLAIGVVLALTRPRRRGVTPAAHETPTPAGSP